MSRIKILSALLFFLFTLVYKNSAFCNEGGLIGNISRIDFARATITIKLKDGSLRQIRFNEKTKFYKKMKPLPADLSAKLSDFRQGELVFIIVSDPKSASPVALSIFDQKAFAVKTYLIQVEELVGGEVKGMNVGTGEMTLQTFSGKEIMLKVTGLTKIFFNNQPAQIVEVRPGTKVAAYCRWLGFEEDKPKVPEVWELIDSGTFVTRKFREKFGLLLANGKVVEVNMKEKNIRVSSEGGQVETIGFSTATRWITATPKIRTPMDFVGYTVYIFGEPQREKRFDARMVVNVMGINTIFQDLYLAGEMKGTYAMLAFGDVVFIDGQWIVVLQGNGKIKIRITNKTIFQNRHREKMLVSQLNKGDRVVVHGIFDEPPVALMVTMLAKGKK